MLQYTCRTCATLFDENTILIPAFEQIIVTTKINDEFNLADEIIALNIEIKKNDGLPQQMCLNCVKQITDIHNFRQLCRKSQTELKKCFKINKFSTSPDVKFSNKTIVDESEMITSNPAYLGKVESVLENSDDFTIGEEVSMIEEMEDATEDKQGIQIIFNEDDEINEVEYLDDIEYESKSLIEEDQSESTENILTTNESTMDEQSQDQYYECNDSEDTSKIMMCPRCKYYVHSSRFKIDRYICIQLTRLNIIPVISSELEFWCFYCCKKFDTKHSLEEHIIESHPIDKPFKCEHCDEYFPTTNKRNRHSSAEHESKNKGKCRCDVCDKIFKNDAYVMKHKKCVHSNGNYECTICFKKFTNIQRFDYHLKSHNPNKRFQCRYCDKTFMQMTHLQYHEETHTNSHRPYKCNECDKDFVHKTEYRIHVRTHGDNLPFICEVCGKGFPAQYLLNGHQQKIHSYNHQCEVCGKIYNTKISLQMHQSSHTGDKTLTYRRSVPKSKEWREKYNKQCRETRQIGRYLNEKLYTCPICSKKFDLPSGLERHMKIHDKNRKYQCDMCNNTYSKSSHLRMHLNRIHLKTQYYDCTICEKRFLDSSSRNFHMKSHTKKQVQCSYCNRIFSEKYMKFHERTHTLEYKYSCQICEENFILVGQLKEHYKKKHTTQEVKEMEAQILANNEGFINVDNDDD